MDKIGNINNIEDYKGFRLGDIEHWYYRILYKIDQFLKEKKTELDIQYQILGYF